MPYVNIKITKESATSDQKAQLIKGVTQLLVDVLGKNPHVIDEVDTDNWGIGGETVTVLRSKPPAEETPKKRGLPEKLVKFIEQRNAAASGISAAKTKPSRKGRKTD